MAGHGKIRKNAQVEPPAVRFDDVAGCDEAVEELQEVVLFLTDPDRFLKVGARMPRGVILHGPPGTGKTLLAKAVAGESGVPFFALSGSDFVDTYVGVGASRVRDLFALARKSEKGAIIFFDEIDAIGRARGGGASGADSEREGTLNQLLVELDGFGARDRVVVVAATNRLDMLDTALLRPGRFDRRVQVGLPAETGRLAILRLHSKGMPIAEPSSLEALARVTAGFAGADLSNMVNEAAIMAARDGRESILPHDLDEGMLRAVAGPQKADRRIAEGELEVIAWHEAGHALAAELCPTHQKAQKVTILARGDAGGLALYGNLDRTLMSQQNLHERMVVAMAGRAAEQIRFGIISSGAANDLEQVNKMAREAVERLGFSPRVGQIISSSGPHQIPLSGETRRVIDEEIGRMVNAAYSDAVALLTDHRAELDAFGARLLEREQVDRADIEDILSALTGGGRRLPARADALPSSGTPVAVPAVEPIPVPERVAADPEPAGERRRRSIPIPRGRRIRTGVEGAAAAIYSVTIPRVSLRAPPRRPQGSGDRLATDGRPRPAGPAIIRRVLDLTPDELLSTTRAVRRRLDLTPPGRPGADPRVPRARPAGPERRQPPEGLLRGGHRPGAPRRARRHLPARLGPLRHRGRQRRPLPRPVVRPGAPQPADADRPLGALPGRPPRRGAGARHGVPRRSHRGARPGGPGLGLRIGAAGGLELHARRARPRPRHRVDDDPPLLRARGRRGARHPLRRGLPGGPDPARPHARDRLQARPARPGRGLRPLGALVSPA